MSLMGLLRRLRISPPNYGHFPASDWTIMRSAWHEAAVEGNVRLAAELLSRGQDFDSRDRYGQTALMLAAVHGQQAIADLLVRHRADLNVTAKYGLSALMLAVVNGNEGIAMALIDAGADLDLKGRGAPGFTGKNAGDLATARGLTDIVEAIRQAQS